MKAIAFSLYGSDPKYTHGAIANARLVKKIYPGWRAVFYVDDTVPSAIGKKLSNLGALVRKGADGNGMFWRFHIHDDPKVEVYLGRDTDSRLNAREAGAVKSWLASGKAFHVIRDHPHHVQPIVGCAWGGIPAKLNFSMSSLIEQWGSQQNYYNEDQLFLAAKVWPLVKGDCLQHDSFGRHIFKDAQPLPPDGWRFVGEVFDAQDRPRPWDWQMRVRHVCGS